MSFYEIDTKNGGTRGCLCLANIYKFPFYGREYYFEYHYWLGAIPVRKRDLGQRSTIPKGFWKAIEAFEQLSKQEREIYQIYG